MVACGSANHWGRELSKKGFKVKLIHPKFVKPYVKRNKNEAVAAEAICEAMARPHMRFVKVKTVKQQDVQSAHRVREKLIQQRAAKINHIRGLVSEYGVIAPVGIEMLRQAIPEWLEDVENHFLVLFRNYVEWLIMCSKNHNLLYSLGVILFLLHIIQACYFRAFSICISLSGALNFPRLSDGGVVAISVSSFSSGSALRYISVLFKSACPNHKDTFLIS
jgi:hypothetical protein